MGCEGNAPGLAPGSSTRACSLVSLNEPLTCSELQVLSSTMAVLLSPSSQLSRHVGGAHPLLFSSS